MDRDDIIKMAKQAKLPYEYDTERVLHLKEVERFAALVAAAEREACAMEADKVLLRILYYEAARWPYAPECRGLCEEIAKAIRARGEQ
ncbi:MAG: hypothetical protein EBX65_01150 [Betaproteobacteria bacterium]|nr:hypothetical protein [Betaproteobacteria bacterium]